MYLYVDVDESSLVQKFVEITFPATFFIVALLVLPFFLFGNNNGKKLAGREPISGFHRLKACRGERYL